MMKSRVSTVVVAFLLALCSMPAWAASGTRQKDHMRTNYFLLGLMGGSPSSGPNAVVGYGFGPVEIRVSGGYNPNPMPPPYAWGLLGELGVNVINTRRFVVQAGAFATYVYTAGDTPAAQAGTGPEVSLSFHGLTAEVGVGYNFLRLRHLSGSFPFVMDAQLGYLYRMR